MRRSVENGNELGRAAKAGSERHRRRNVWLVERHARRIYTRGYPSGYGEEEEESIAPQRVIDTPVSGLIFFRKHVIHIHLLS